MAQTKLKMLLQVRRDKVFTSTYKLEAGEPGFEISTNTLKIGDGIKTWAELDFANEAQIAALIKVTDDKVVALTEAVNKLNDTYATDAEVEAVRSALDAAKLDKTTYNAYVEAHQNDYTNTQIDDKFNPYRTSAAQDAIDATFALKTDVETEFAKYTTTTDQQAIDAEQDRRLGVLEAKPFDTYATKTEVQGVATDLSEYETANDARVKAIEDEIDGFNYADATETANALNDRYTKGESDAKFETIANVNQVRTDVTNITKEGGLIATAKSEAIAAAKTETETQIATFKTTVVDPIDGRLDDVEEQLATVSNVMDFVGAGANLPAAEVSNKGDVFVINEGDNAGREYVFDGTTWVEFGYATGNENAIAALQEALAQEVTDRTNGDTALGGRIDTLSGTVTENKNTYDAYVLDTNGRLDTIEAKAAMGITADDIAAWNAEKGVKAIVDANKATWDKAGTALQAADLADYAKTADVVTNEEFTAFEATNTKAIEDAAKAGTDAAAAVAEDLAEYIDGKSMSDADLKKYAEDEADAAETAAKGYTDTEIADFNTETVAPLAERVKAIEDAPHTTKDYVDTQDLAILAQAQAYADAKDHKDTTYTVAATTEALQFTVTPSEGEAQTVTLVAPTVDTGVMSVEAGNDIVVTPGEDGKVTVAHETFTTGTYEKTPESSDKTGDVYMMTAVTVDNGHVTGANVQSLAHALEALTFILDGGTSSN